MKPPQARPTPQNIQARLQANLGAQSSAARRLQHANLGVVERRAEAAASASAARSEAERRADLFQVAEQAFDRIRNGLRDQILENAPESAESGSSLLSFSLNDVRLTVGWCEKTSPLSRDRYEPTFDIIAHSTIGIQFRPDHWRYEGRSHSLWFCDAQEESVFRWYETSFMFSALIGKRGRQNPFAMNPDRDALGALSTVMTVHQVAWPFTTFDQGQEEDFIERWLDWFADAVEGKLRQPSNMPERDPKGSWRR